MNEKKIFLIVSISRIFNSFRLLFPLRCHFCWCYFSLYSFFSCILFYICIAVDVTAAAAAVAIPLTNTSETYKYEKREAVRFLCRWFWWRKQVKNIATTKSSTSTDDSRTHFHFILSAPMHTPLRFRNIICICLAETEHFAAACICNSRLH